MQLLYRLTAVLLFLLILNLFPPPLEAGPFRINRNDYKIYYATTRYNDSQSKSHPVYSNKRHLSPPGAPALDSIEYGSTSVTIPAGLLTVDSAQSFESFKVRLKVNDQAWDQASVSSSKQISRNEFEHLIAQWTGVICIFVHGYDESFQDSTRDTALISSELERKLQSKSINVLPVLFSWPSINSASEYAADEANLNWSKLPFREFMEMVAAKKGKHARVFLIAHSLGARMAFELTNSRPLLENPGIEKLFLSSSDYDYHMALQRKNALEKLARDRVYIMVSDRDGPLITSQLLHNSPRLGRPIDPPSVSRQPKDYARKSFWQSLLTEAVDLIVPETGYDSPDAQKWLQNGRARAVKFGDKTQLFDVTELVTADFGHRLAWPVISSLLAYDSVYPLGTSVVYKTPDKLMLELYGGTPPFLYQYNRIVKERYGIK